METAKEFALRSPYREFIDSKNPNQTQEYYPKLLCQVRNVLGKELLMATEFDLEGFIRDCRDRGVKGSTCGTYKAVISSFYKWALDHKLRPDNPSKLMLAFPTGARSGANPKALTIVQRKKVLDCLIWDGSINDYQMSLAILVGFYEGFRRFEIAKLQWEDVEFKNNRIKVFGKGRKPDGEPDYVPLSDTLRKKLDDYKMLVDKAGVDSRWIFYHQENPNKPQRYQTVSNWFKIIGRRCGFDKSVKFSSHSGRHIFCTSLNEGKIVPIDAIKMTRHKSVDMYASKYVKIEEAVTQSQYKKVIP